MADANSSNIISVLVMEWFADETEDAFSLYSIVVCMGRVVGYSLAAQYTADYWPLFIVVCVFIVLGTVPLTWRVCLHRNAAD